MLLCGCWCSEVSALWGNVSNVTGCLQDLGLWAWWAVSSSDPAVLWRAELHDFWKAGRWGTEASVPHFFLNLHLQSTHFSLSTRPFKPKQYFAVVCSAWQFWPLCPQADRRWIWLLRAGPSLLPFLASLFFPCSFSVLNCYSLKPLFV